MLFTIASLIRGLFPVWAGAFAYLYYVAFKASAEYISVSYYDPSRPIDDWAIQVLAALIVTAGLTAIAALMGAPGNSVVEDRMPLAGLRSSLGRAIYGLTLLVAVLPALMLVVQAGSLFAALMTLAFTIFALPLLISGVASALDG